MVLLFGMKTKRFYKNIMKESSIMYEAFSKLVENISNFMYSYLLIILLLVVGLYFTFRTKFIQARLLGESIRLVTEKKGDKNSVSAFEALMVSTASRVGSGNFKSSPDFWN